MIHDFKEEYLDLPLQDFVLSFDDGLLTPFIFLKELLLIDTPLIFNISTGLIRRENQPAATESINCFDALIKARAGNFENYMTWENIRVIAGRTKCTIAGHSHNHSHVKNMDLNEKIEYINNDTGKMMREFCYKNIKIRTFCFPFNYEDTFYKGILSQTFGFKHFLGGERIDINTIRKSEM